MRCTIRIYTELLLNEKSERGGKLDGEEVGGTVLWLQICVAHPLPFHSVGFVPHQAVVSSGPDSTALSPKRCNDVRTRILGEDPGIEHMPTLTGDGRPAD